MSDGKRPEDITLLDLLIDGFEKNETLIWLALARRADQDERLAVRKFGALVEEARRWKGTPVRSDESSGRRLAAWAQGDPMGPIHEWIREDEGRHR